MTLQTVTVQLPQTIYQRLLARSSGTERSVSDETALLIVKALPEEEVLPDDLELELAQLDFLQDDELWRAAQMRATDEDNDRMQILLTKQQRGGLLPSEQAEADALSHAFNRIMLVRAKAAVLLKSRGHDIGQLSTPA